MHMRFIYLAAGILTGLTGILSCVEINEELGKEYIPTRHQYDVHTDTIYLQDIRMKQIDRLSGYSSSRITVGAVRDASGTTSRSSAFTLIPTGTDMDFGEKPKCTQFHFTAVRDTLSWPDENQAHIIQNINVFKLAEALDEDDSYISSVIDESTLTRVAPTVTYFGQDSLSFNFNPDFGDEYIEAIQAMQKDPKKEGLDSVSNYVKKLPGIYITADIPSGEGGRINMFDLKMEISDGYYVSGNYAELKFRSKYGHRENVDTSFLFFFGAQDMQVYEDAESEYVTPDRTPQYALNLSHTENGTINPDQAAADVIYVEGGDGVKPVISSKEIKDSLNRIFALDGTNPEDVIIHKASVILPYDFRTEDYDRMYLYPDRLSPTCRITLEDEDSEDEQVTYAGLTDASVSTENQGDINRSLNCYAPDISHHVQEVLRASDDSLATGRYDIWLLVMVNEVITSTNEQQQEMSEYYQNLAYASYYNSLYGGYGYGYGYGYGGYGYNSYYNNYYNYMLAAQYASASAVQEETVAQLDKDRFYRLVINGPASESRPQLTVVYSYIQRDAVNQQNEEQ